MSEEDYKSESQSLVKITYAVVIWAKDNLMIVSLVCSTIWSLVRVRSLSMGVQCHNLGKHGHFTNTSTQKFQCSRGKWNTQNHKSTNERDGRSALTKHTEVEKEERIDTYQVGRRWKRRSKHERKRDDEPGSKKTDLGEKSLVWLWESAWFRKGGEQLLQEGEAQRVWEGGQWFSQGAACSHSLPLKEARITSLDTTLLSLFLPLGVLKPPSVYFQ